MVRRKPCGDHRDDRHVWRVFFFIGVLLWAIDAATPLVFKTIYLDIKSVTVPDHAIGEDPMIEVYRKIKSDFPGSFSVEFRNAENDTFACQTIYPDTINYQVAANQKNPITMHLSEWAGASGEYQSRCAQSRRYQTGLFYTITCHWRDLPFGFRWRRCVNGNVFERHNTFIEGGKK